MSKYQKFDGKTPEQRRRIIEEQIDPDVRKIIEDVFKKGVVYNSKYYFRGYEVGLN